MRSSVNERRDNSGRAPLEPGRQRGLGLNFLAVGWSGLGGDVGEGIGPILLDLVRLREADTLSDVVVGELGPDLARFVEHPRGGHAAGNGDDTRLVVGAPKPVPHWGGHSEVPHRRAEVMVHMAAAGPPPVAIARRVGMRTPVSDLVPEVHRYQPDRKGGGPSPARHRDHGRIGHCRCSGGRRDLLGRRRKVGNVGVMLEVLDRRHPPASHLVHREAV